MNENENKKNKKKKPYKFLFDMEDPEHKTVYEVFQDIVNALETGTLMFFRRANGDILMYKTINISQLYQKLDFIKNGKRVTLRPDHPIFSMHVPIAKILTEKERFEIISTERFTPNLSVEDKVDGIMVIPKF
ncbi:MAG: hypothetical protein ACTSR8_19355 [Promethearchaeota archaeon]